MLDYGLIGLGPEWQAVYRPALQRLRARTRMRGVHVSPMALAEPVAGEFASDICVGMTPFFERVDLRAVILLDVGPHLTWIFDAARGGGQTVFLAQRLWSDAARAGLLHPDAAWSSQATFVPELRWRFLPATRRLRELLASGFGPLAEMKLSVTLPCGPASPGIEAERTPSGTEASFIGQAARLSVMEACDFIEAVAGVAPQRIVVESAPVGEAAEGLTFRFEFAPDHRVAKPPTCWMTVRRESGDALGHVAVTGAEPVVPAVTGSLRTAKGAIEVLGPTQIVWEAAGVRSEESLDEERAGADVLFDAFFRRAAGGLLPVPSLDGLRHAWQLATVLFPMR